MLVFLEHGGRALPSGAVYCRQETPLQRKGACSLLTNWKWLCVEHLAPQG